MVVIVNYNMGNVGSIANMIKKIGGQATLSADKAVIAKADKLILPGVGAFDNGMKNLKQLGLIDLLQTKVMEQKTPLLGICLGMQLLGMGSEEGELPGLGYVVGKVVKFSFDDSQSKLKIPHMGWNTVDIAKESPLFNQMDPEPRFYFVHSYYMVCENKRDILSTTHHGVTFTSSVQKDNIYGVQFHPEKSHKYGMRLLKNFLSV